MAGFRETISVAEDFTWSDCYGRNSGRQELVSCRKSGPVRKRQRTAALQDAPRPNEADEFPKVLECGSPSKKHDRKFLITRLRNAGTHRRRPVDSPRCSLGIVIAGVGAGGTWSRIRLGRQPRKPLHI